MDFQKSKYSWLRGEREGERIRKGKERVIWGPNWLQNQAGEVFH